MNYIELNEVIDFLFEKKRAWEQDNSIIYIWGNVLAKNNQLKYYINDNKEIIGEITYYDKTIAGFSGKMWYLDGILIGFTRNIDNKYATPSAMRINDCDAGYYIKGISESLKILADEKRQADEQKNELLNSLLGLA